LSVVITAVSWNCSDAYASQRDKDIKKLLDSPSIVEKFKKTQGKRTKKTKDKESPLVKEARSFALYLNPPAKVEKRASKINKRTKSIVKKPTNVSAKFKVIGTSYAEYEPSKSLALLDIPGKGLRWVRQGEEVGHLVIEEVKPGGTIVVADGKNTSEMTADKPIKKSLLRGEQPDMKELSGQIKSILSKTSSPRKRVSKSVGTPDSSKPKGPPKLSEEEIEQQGQVMKDLLAQVEQMMAASGGGADSPDASETKKPVVKNEAVKKREAVERPKAKTSDVKTVEEASGFMDKISEKLEQIKSSKDSAEIDKLERAVQQESEHLRRAILELKAVTDSPEDKEMLDELSKDLAKIQQDIRRSQSRKRIEKVRSKTRR